MGEAHSGTFMLPFLIPASSRQRHPWSTSTMDRWAGAGPAEIPRLGFSACCRTYLSVNSVYMYIDMYLLYMYIHYVQYSTVPPV